VPDYEVIRRIGVGAYGEVWLARNVFGEYRAIKMVWRHSFADDARPFQREFEGIKRFEPISRSHPSQLAILHVGNNEQAGCFYYVMELADDADSNQSSVFGNQLPVSHTQLTPLNTEHGSLNTYRPHTLRHDLKLHGRLPVDQVIELGLTLTEALAHLHAHGLVHRDIKPSNIIFVKGKPKLADIGLVTDAGDERSIIGTEGYLAPEGPGKRPADLYSLGKVLYEAAMGRDRRDFPDLPENWQSLPDLDRLLELNEILLKACAALPQERYQSPEEMAADLALLQRGGSVVRKHRFRRSARLATKFLLGALLLGVLAVLAIFLSQARHSQGFHSKVAGVDALVERGNEVLKRRTPEGLATALDYFNQVATKDPKSAPALIGIFQAHLLRFSSGFAAPPPNEGSNLRVAATNLIKLRPDLAEARIASSVLHYMDGNLAATLADARKAAAKMPTASPNGFALVHSECGWYSMNAFDPEGGLRELLLAERARPSDPFIETFVGLAYALLHDFPRALEHYDTAILLQPLQNVVYEQRANVYREQGKIPEALKDFETYRQMASGSEPKDTNNSFNELRSAFLQGGPEAYWSKNLEIQLRVTPPDDPHEVAVCLKHLGRLQEAYDCLNRIEDPGRLRDCLWFDVSLDRSDARFKALVAKCGSAVTPAPELSTHR
jgi:serine/threonine protein kinase/tetratricopeptide (TPR) repeat protein